ncbi:putative alpha-N-acetylglucosaminidase [Coniochaeta ligniaria NRRL 30616]|uniref:Putative alpha-N-acetylglucosaminidase n=1 Tax=Coniochaeta ligniaria NRRL 30616 TaxID=1408157 RepID=A0A1J7ILS0_9PEZI|nr:putative alpha-N-acetylglucosaminidase [Coniochaeta ligniaria NRRL 30616]
MRLLPPIILPALAAAAGVLAIGGADVSTAGIEALVQRRLPQHTGAFQFKLVNVSTEESRGNDTYVVSCGDDGKIIVQGTTLSALLSGLHSYLTNVVHVDIWWYIGSRLDVAPATLPCVSTPLQGSSIVPYRYHFNTVTTSYTSAFWTWEDWQLQLDWMALRGINLALAWTGVEKIFVEVFQEIGLTQDDIEDFLSGPAFLAWNRFGNIQGSWGGSLPFAWVDDQFQMQLKIIQRMVELGMIPILPAFPGFVPRAITRVYPDVNVTNGSAWEKFPATYTNDTFLDPFDPRFAQLQKSFIAKQKAYYGDVTSFYTLDQFNENNPASGDNGYLANVSLNTWKSLKAADPDSIWVMQGWLFSSNSAFWTNSRIEAFLGGVPVDSDMLVLDLFSESSPQWQRTNSYYGKPWIWCQLHNYGGNMGLYGQILNVTINPVQALHNSSSMVGFGLSMEGQEGNEIIYDLLLDQAWTSNPIETEEYFHNWVTSRYAGNNPIPLPDGLYSAWDIVRTTVYNNTNLTVNAVPKAILELVPSTTGLVNRTGHHATQVTYDPSVLLKAWSLLYGAGVDNPYLFANPSYQYDLVDWTRQVLSNAFISLYQQLVSTYTNTSTLGNIKCRNSRIRGQGAQLIALLRTLDDVLATNDNFKLSTWIGQARSNANSSADADFMEYEARNQVTLWGPTGQITDYASKSWAGLVSSYYVPRWQMFIDYLVSTPLTDYNQTAFAAGLLQWEVTWVQQTSEGKNDDKQATIEEVLSLAIKQWSRVLTV